MIKYEQNEIEYVIRECNIMLEVRDNMGSIQEDEIKGLTDRLEEDDFVNMQKIIDNESLVNSDKGINKTADEFVTWVLGMFVWLDEMDDVETVKHYVPNEKEEYYTIYQKLWEAAIEENED